MIFLIVVEWKPKAALYTKITPVIHTILPSLNQSQYNHHAHTYRYIAIYNIHIILLFVLMCSLVLCMLMCWCAKAFSFISIIVINDNIKLWELARILYNLLSFYLYRSLDWKYCRKFGGLLEIYIGIRIVTKYNLLFDIMTLTFCNNHCQHLSIGEIYNVT